ncbi:hypothetical protein ABZ372_47655 [Streptomyces sp. NPDC005921]|uniref:hypothetical protein n=1 Tax=Streptomyces sp. NPDC005827 TaxID=3157070 RepID=UPI0033C30752
MSMNENVITLHFTDRATAFRALGGLKDLSAENAQVRSAVLIECLDDGSVRVTGDTDGATEPDTATAARIARIPLEGAVVLAEVREEGTDTLDMLALWYGAVLERIPAGSARGGLRVVEGGAAGAGEEETAARSEGEPPENAWESSGAVATLRWTTAA